jgi:hypothetical protein
VSSAYGASGSWSGSFYMNISLWNPHRRCTKKLEVKVKWGWGKGYVPETTTSRVWADVPFTELRPFYTVVPWKMSSADAGLVQVYLASGGSKSLAVEPSFPGSNPSSLLSCYVALGKLLCSQASSYCLCFGSVVL